MIDKLPWAIRQQCLWMVRDYDRSRREYIRRRMEIIDAGGDRAETYISDGVECRAPMPSSHNASRSTEDIAVKLDALERTAAFRQMRAVEHARDRIGQGLPDAIKDTLRDSIMLNCIDGRKYPFERLSCTAVSRSGFYRARDGFLIQIATELGLI